MHLRGAVAWLVSDAGQFVTGEAIRVDGELIAAGTRISGLMDPHSVTTRYAESAMGAPGWGRKPSMSGRSRVRRRRSAAK